MSSESMVGQRVLVAGSVTGTYLSDEGSTLVVDIPSGGSFPAGVEASLTQVVALEALRDVLREHCETLPIICAREQMIEGSDVTVTFVYCSACGGTEQHADDCWSVALMDRTAAILSTLDEMAGTPKEDAS